MLDPGSGGGGQISNLISDDGKSPKVLLCHLHSVDILCECRWLAGIEILSGAKLNFLSCHPPALFPSLPSPIPPSFFLLPFFLSLTLLPCTPCKECKITFGVFFSTSLSSSSACLSFNELAVSVSWSLSCFPLSLHVQTCSFLYVRARF